MNVVLVEGLEFGFGIIVDDYCGVVWDCVEIECLVVIGGVDDIVIFDLDCFVGGCDVDLEGVVLWFD